LRRIDEGARFGAARAAVVEAREHGPYCLGVRIEHALSIAERIEP